MDDQLENAAVMLDACRSELTRLGKLDEVLQLRGLEVTSPASADVALMHLLALSKDEDTAEVREATIDVLRAATRNTALLAS